MKYLLSDPLLGQARYMFQIPLNDCHVYNEVNRPSDNVTPSLVKFSDVSGLAWAQVYHIWLLLQKASKCYINLSPA